jgi:hypothetical protein
MTRIERAHHSSYRFFACPFCCPSTSLPVAFERTAATLTKIQSTMMIRSEFDGGLLWQLTICTGLSMSLWALNSALTYISPSTRSSTPNLFLCVRRMVLYRGMGGKSAAGACRNPCDAPASVAVARSRVKTRMFAVDKKAQYSKR